MNHSLREPAVILERRFRRFRLVSALGKANTTTGRPSLLEQPTGESLVLTRCF